MASDIILIRTGGSDPAEAARAYGVDFAEQLNVTVHCFSVANGRITSGLTSLLADDDSGSVDRLAE